MRSCLALFAMPAQVTPQDTVGPKEVFFAQTTHVVIPGATNVVLEVEFVFGNRGREPDSVDYYTRDGTAKAGRDYGAASGTLPISWTGQARLEIPIHAEAFDSNEKSFQVFLSKADALVWNSPATVIIRGAPRLQIARVGTILLISWPADFEGCVLERGKRLETDWSEVSASAVLVEDRLQIEEPLSGAACFYRLRR
jgi:hypothetical protein